jgi:mannose-1-phosphate guanylyltransferase
MKSNGNNYCVILAGGKGRRLWPCSRSNYPKQFVDFFGVGRTQLQKKNGMRSSVSSAL